MGKRRTWWPHKLEKGVQHWTARDVPAPFSNAWLTITQLAAGTLLALPEGYAYDGATLVPTLHGMKLATAFHDATYQFAEDIAAAWGWTVREVLAFGDEIFYERMLQDGASRCAAWVYYRAVRGGGYGFHQAAKKWRRMWGLAALRSQRGK